MKIRIQKGDNSLDVAAKMAMERLYDLGHTVDWIGVQKYTVDGKRITLAQLLKMAKITVCLIALMFVAGQAMAQQRPPFSPAVPAAPSKPPGSPAYSVDPRGQVTLYGPDGRVLSRWARDTQGNTVIYGADGRKLGTIGQPKGR